MFHTFSVLLSDILHFSNLCVYSTKLVRKINAWFMYCAPTTTEYCPKYYIKELCPHHDQYHVPATSTIHMNVYIEFGRQSLFARRLGVDSDG